MCNTGGVGDVPHMRSNFDTVSICQCAFYLSVSGRS